MRIPYQTSAEFDVCMQDVAGSSGNTSGKDGSVPSGASEKPKLSDQDRMNSHIIQRFGPKEAVHVMSLLPRHVATESRYNYCLWSDHLSIFSHDMKCNNTRYALIFKRACTKPCLHEDSRRA